MFEALASLGIFSAFILLRIGEYRLHKQNYDFLTFAGAAEEIPTIMSRYYLLEWVFFIACIFEFLFFPKFINNSQQIVSLITLMIFAGLRVWSIHVLGRYWSMRCLFVSGFPVVKKGPYRFIKHPEYVSRMGEMIGVSLFLGTYLAFTAYAIGTIYLLRMILVTEKTQLQKFSTSDSY